MNKLAVMQVTVASRLTSLETEEVRGRAHTQREWFLWVASNASSSAARSTATKALCLIEKERDARKAGLTMISGGKNEPLAIKKLRHNMRQADKREAQSKDEIKRIIGSNIKW